MSPRFACRPLAVAALACSASLAAQAQTVLTVSTWLPPTHILSETQKDWCDLLETEGAGKMNCNILPRAVAAPPGTFDAVRNGLADVSYTVHGYTPGRFVLTQMAEFPFLGNSSEADLGGLSARRQQASGHCRRAPGREGDHRVHARPRHRLQHQAPDRQGRRPRRH